MVVSGSESKSLEVAILLLLLLLVLFCPKANNKKNSNSNWLIFVIIKTFGGKAKLDICFKFNLT